MDMAHILEVKGTGLMDTAVEGPVIGDESVGLGESLTGSEGKGRVQGGS